MTSSYETPDGEASGVAGANGAAATPPPADEDGTDAEVIDADVIDEVVDGEVVDGEVVDGEVVDGEGVDDEAVSDTPVDPVARANAERDEYLDALRRLQADFENYRKRVVKQQADEAGRGALALVDKLLPVLDTLDQAATHLGDPESADARALLAASSQLNDVLAKAGLERVDPTGEPFDPNAHEAVGHLPDDDIVDGETIEGDGPLVAQVMRAGYRWKGNVVRPAMVMVRG
jgi:molecular chaperone GrpE